MFACRLSSQVCTWCNALCKNSCSWVSCAVNRVMCGCGHLQSAEKLSLISSSRLLVLGFPNGGDAGLFDDFCFGLRCVSAHVFMFDTHICTYNWSLHEYLAVFWLLTWWNWWRTEAGSVSLLFGEHQLLAQKKAALAWAQCMLVMPWPAITGLGGQSLWIKRYSEHMFIVCGQPAFTSFTT